MPTLKRFTLILILVTLTACSAAPTSPTETRPLITPIVPTETRPSPSATQTQPSATQTQPSASPTLTPSPSLAGTILAENRQKWESQHINHYRFHLSHRCLCGFGNIMPLAVEVKDEQIVSILDSQGQPVSEGRLLHTFIKYNTIEKLFGLLDTVIHGGADKVTVDYNADYGYPHIIEIDYRQQAFDDEIGFTLDEFEILE